MGKVRYKLEKTNDLICNYDGLLNILDVVLIVAMILDNQPEDLVADINGDGGINIQDIILLINIILSSE